MNYFRILCLSILGVLALFIISCSEDVFIDDDEAAADQLILDIAIINDYITEKGYTDVDTTSIGVRYTIIEEGTGESIEPNDLISFDIIGRLANDSIWGTTIASVDQENGTFDSLSVYTPFIYTYTTDGWNLTGLIDGFEALESGYKSGVTAVMGRLKIGGHGRLMIPSGLAYREFPPSGLDIPINAVLVFDIYPVQKR